jgi:hypothetical protein
MKELLIPLASIPLFIVEDYRKTTIHTDGSKPIVV